MSGSMDDFAKQIESLGPENHEGQFRRLLEFLDQAYKEHDEVATLKVIAMLHKHLAVKPEAELTLIDAADFMRKPPPPPDAIISGIIDRGDKVAIIGKSKNRKSFFALQLALCLASCRRFLGLSVGETCRNVMLIQMEVQPSHYYRRVYTMSNAMGISADQAQRRLWIHSGRGTTNAGSDEWFEQIEHLAKKHSTEAIIMDPLYKIAQGEENQAEGMKPVLNKFDQLCEATGAALLYVHHDPKGVAGLRETSDRGSGSGVVGRDYDSCMALSTHDTEEDAVVIEFLLRNYAPQEPFTAKWQNAHFERRDDILPVKHRGNKRPESPTVAASKREAIIGAAMNLVKNKPISITEFRLLVQRLPGATQKMQRDIFDQLLADGRLVRWKTKGQESRGELIGLPEQVPPAELPGLAR